MTVHESSINFHNLIRDLAEMYPFDVPEVIITELVANSLDAGATQIAIDYDPQKRVLVVQDDGSGMDASQFEEYHDFAAALKKRGISIGFAGVGAKISFNIADKVVTETRSKTFAGGSNWHLVSKKKLIWEEIEPNSIHGTGTRVEVWFKSSDHIPYHATDSINKILHRHYLPLFDLKFLDLYSRLDLYSDNLRFIINGQTLLPTNLELNLGLTHINVFFPTKAGKRVGYGVFGLSSKEYPVDCNVCGVFLCTRGKVIKGELFNQFPGSQGPRIFGIVEIPEFVRFLTTSKTDFIRKGKHREFESYYDPIRQEFKTWLKKLGVESTEIIGTDEAFRLEKELKKLINDIPEFSEFFGFHSRIKVLLPTNNGATFAQNDEGVETTFPEGDGDKGAKICPTGTGLQPGQTLVENNEGQHKATPISRTARRGPKIAFTQAPAKIQLAWVEGNNIVINSGHPAYIKSQSNSIARRVHSLFSIASAIHKFLASEGDGVNLIDRTMTAWGKQ